MSAGKILVVDDDPQIRRVMKATLVGHGYEVIAARTGEDALEILPHEMPNLVLLDMNMPGMGGLETCRAIRAGTDTPVIILSVRNSEKDKVAALDAGADDYVTKPFGIEENERTRIFDKLFRGRRHRFETKGTGMGLAIAKGIVEAHGERIWVESEAGQGAAFYFSLSTSGGGRES